MTRCSAPKCTNNHNKGFSLFRFPTESERRQQWIANSSIGPTLKNGARLCEVHFEKSQFEGKIQAGKKQLKKTAVPTLFQVPNPLVPQPKRNVHFEKSQFEHKMPASKKQLKNTAVPALLQVPNSSVPQPKRNVHFEKCQFEHQMPASKKQLKKTAAPALLQVPNSSVPQPKRNSDEDMDIIEIDHIDGEKEPENSELEIQDIASASTTLLPGEPLREDKRKSPQLDSQKRLDEAFLFLKEVTTAVHSPDTDECYFYGQLLATRLRKLDAATRRVAMHEIDNYLFRVESPNPPQSVTMYSQPQAVIPPHVLAIDLSCARFEQEQQVIPPTYESGDGSHPLCI